MLKNKMQFVVLSFIFAFLLSGCSTKKTKQEWESYNDNEEWSYFMPEDEDTDVVPFLFPGKYVVDIEIETKNEFKTYIERYTELETCKLLLYDIDRGTVQKKMDFKKNFGRVSSGLSDCRRTDNIMFISAKKLCLRYFSKNRVSEKLWRAFAQNRNYD